MKTAICPGSFDPVTLGHMDIIRRASKIFDRVIVAVMVNPAKKTAFTLDERICLLQKATKEMEGVEVVGFEGFLADYARMRDACAIVKGLRAVSDFEYEFQMALINQKLNAELETMFLTTQAQNMYLSSSMVKDIASFGGDISSFVPACILEDIQQRLCKGEN
ncbi:pantetheine-phosphate adenylyltransferase [Anaeromassilibacillus sp. An200]|uniref:Phosphopantetheine adenylyltransferase n=1 Tax=Candidatus Caccousia stercoris TaxID=2840723 RepID=A0A9D1K2M5_9FIRM|nr:pantetheine-phosphate adenylyltransferase [Anaeromassilibacillus sp. An200]OUP12005.1 pantetheine-phosphate adenylyltransferase [Anaeromassilibacillus sp. An200]HIS78278.1 pantetheine-phosphate adenylyltransferase [Candidatus Caccousia stercoris]